MSEQEFVVDESEGENKPVYKKRKMGRKSRANARVLETLSVTISADVKNRFYQMADKHAKDHSTTIGNFMETLINDRYRVFDK